MTEPLKLKIDPEALKIKDQRVSRIMASRMPLETFVMLITPDDPFILIGDTVYALTEQEFHAMRPVMASETLPDESFNKVLAMEDLSFMSESDREFIDKASSDSGNCPICKYRRYRDEVAALVKKYSIDVPLGSVEQPDTAKYPETTEPIIPKVLDMLGYEYKVPLAERRSCMDCTEKHIAQAWVLSQECINGYPEHIAYVVGHLGEAIDEAPKELADLRRTLEFCLARTNYTRKPFVPLGALSAHIRLGRVALGHDEPVGNEEVNENDTLFELTLTSGMLEELKGLDMSVRTALADDCRLILDEITLGVENMDRVKWLGRMAVASDRIAQFAPRTANMIRGRRLVFGAAPELSKDAGYDMSDILELLTDGYACDDARQLEH